MIRDARMMALVSSEKEPITPFINKVRALYDEKGISSILVIGGCGDYFEVADTVVMMDGYVPSDVTARALEIARSHRATESAIAHDAAFGQLSIRSPEPRGLEPQGESRKVVARRLDTISFGEVELDLGGIEQLVEVSQVRAIAEIMQWLTQQRLLDGKRSLAQILDVVEDEIAKSGLDGVATFRACGNLALPRRFELAGAINRLRTATFAISPQAE
mmetsp:Transcript_4066/g.10277  ORF Transcript_4066/g.10277 Transcript_4066/m.10277 type:complete len:217 (-) Transcript_4066:50-700(-)